MKMVAATHYQNLLNRSTASCSKIRSLRHQAASTQLSGCLLGALCLRSIGTQVLAKLANAALVTSISWSLYVVAAAVSNSGATYAA